MNKKMINKMIMMMMKIKNKMKQKEIMDYLTHPKKLAKTNDFNKIIY